MPKLIGFRLRLAWSQICTWISDEFIHLGNCFWLLVHHRSDLQDHFPLLVHHMHYVHHSGRWKHRCWWREKWPVHDRPVRIMTAKCEDKILMVCCVRKLRMWWSLKAFFKGLDCYEHEKIVPEISHIQQRHELRI